MEIVKIDHHEIPQLSAMAACIGYFDGFHRGHTALCRKALELAEKKGLSSCVITFDPDPWTVFFPDRKITHILTMEDKIRIAENMGFDRFLILQFTKEFAALSTDAFHDVLYRLHIHDLVCGFDFHYGTKNSGNTATLLAQDRIKIHVIDAVMDGEQKVSSTRIEACLKKGDVLQAAWMLEACYTICGSVQRGFQRGKSLLNIPTVNVDPEPEYIVPDIGVYSGLCFYEEQAYPAMINIGNNPTFDNERNTLEAHLLFFDRDIYDKQVRIGFLDKIRPEIRFDSADALKEQLHKDKKTVMVHIHEQKGIVEQTLRRWNKNLFIG